MLRSSMTFTVMLVLAPLMSHIGTPGWLTGLCRSLGVFVVFPLLFCVMGLICMRRDDT